MRLVAILLLLFCSMAHGAAARSLVQPLDLNFGASCAALKEKYSTELWHQKDEIESIRILGAGALFPQAYKIIASCEQGVFNALFIWADSAEMTDATAVPVLHLLQNEFEKQYVCPDIADKTIRCGIFQADNVFVVYTGEHSVVGKFALVYGYAADPAMVSAKILALQSGN